jgi:uncharacterized membrane protein
MEQPMTMPTYPRAMSPGFILGSITFAVLGTLVFMAAAQLFSGGKPSGYGDAPFALMLHVGTVIPALFLGAPVLLMKKGTPLHKALGRIWASLMITTSISSFWLTGLTGGIGPIHIFSAVTLVSIPWAVICARKGDFVRHQRAMIGPYIGLFIAGLFAFLPGRMMGNLVFGQ